MAAPTVPTATTLCTEALIKCGYSSPKDPLITRAEDYLLNEIKNDIWLLGKRLKPLQAEHVEVLTPNQARFAFPSGFSSILDVRILYGDEVLDVTGTAASTVTVDSDDDSIGEDEAEGREILIYSGTGKGSLSQCTSYDEDTYIATVYPVWSNTANGTAPAIADTYFWVDQSIPLELRPITHHDLISLPQLKGPPRILYQVGDETHQGYYYLYPTPDEDHYYGIDFNYYINLLTLDLTSARMSTLYARWRNLWIQGVKAKQLDTDDDSRATIEIARYFAMVKDTVILETYGRNIKPHYTGVKA